MFRLQESAFHRYEHMLDEIPINTLFARSVLKRQVSGKVFVDDLLNPAVFYIVHKYGMSLLYGDANNAAFNASFRDYALGRHESRSAVEWMQAWPHTWDPVLARLWHNHDAKGCTDVELHQRVNFRFDRSRYEMSKPKAIPAGMAVERSGSETFAAMSGSVVPGSFWNNAEDFGVDALGFDLLCEGQVVSQAFSAFLLDGQLELGMETLASFRGQGLAGIACGRLIDHCIAHGLEPVWACREGNVASFQLALKLGFVPARRLPYYRLPFE